MRVLVAEDEKKVSKFLRGALEGAGMIVDTVEDSEELLTALRMTPYEALVLDRMLHHVDAISHIPVIRRQYPQLRILVLSALGDSPQKADGLNEGADDYLGKPFHIPELVARLRALTRRESSSPKTHLLVYEDISLDLEKYRTFRGEKKIELTKKEFQVLSLLIRRPGVVFSKMQILDQVWDLNHHPESNIVEVIVANLRAKIDKGRKKVIHSQRGIGYWLGNE